MRRGGRGVGPLAALAVPASGHDGPTSSGGAFGYPKVTRDYSSTAATPATRRQQACRGGQFIDQGSNNFWGVQVFGQEGQEYVSASDRDFGLYIFRYTSN